MEDPTIPKSERSEPDKASNETTIYDELIDEAVGDYIIEEYIGQGGEAVVFRARGASTGRQYALKVFGLDDRQQSNVSGALPEARAQSSVEHPNVVQVIEPGLATISLEGVETDILYIPMQYSTLGNCQDVALFKDTQITTTEIESIIDLFDGLRSIHEKQIVHRDIKPANILRFEETRRGGTVVVLKVTDFGMALVSVAIAGGPHKPSGLTPEYMAPEQLDGIHTNAGDIYSLGATLYYMVTGQMPIAAPADRSNLKGWQKAHKESPRPNPMDDNPGCPPQLALLIMRMMSVAPSKRPSVADCITILDSYRSYLTEKALSRFSIPSGLKSQIENGHTGPGQYNITFTPKFNSIFDPEVHLKCGTKLFVIRIQMEHPIFNEYRRLVQYMAEKFSDTFCMYEAYGAYDIHVLIWTDDERVDLLKSELRRQFAGSEVRINEAKDVYHLHEANWRRGDGITLVGALAIQEDVELDGVSAGDYIPKASYPPQPADHTIRAFTYVHALTNASMNPTMLQTAIVSSVRQRMLDLLKITDPANGKKKFPRITLIEFASDPRNFDEPVAMVNFVARDYHFIQELPTSIIELGGNAVKTSTFLETGRLVIQSDKILF